MGYICLKPNGSCPTCDHYRYDDKRTAKACFAGQDLNIPNGGIIPTEDPTQGDEIRTPWGGAVD